MTGPKQAIALALAASGTALLLSVLDPAGVPFSGFVAYLMVSAASAAGVVIVWRLVVPAERPGWLPYALGVALALRLGVGVGLLYALPAVGYEEPVQQAGYVFRDAYNRDRAAWSMATGDAPLTEAFVPRERGDQYGGMLFLSGAVYRYLSPSTHRPLLVVVLAAVASSLTTLLGWRFAALSFTPRAAALTAWGLALFPEAILLGASQMREPFVTAAVAGAFYGFAEVRQGAIWRGLAAIVLCVGVLALPFSPPYALAILLALGVGWVWVEGTGLERKLWAFAPLLLLGVLSAYLLGRAWSALGNLSQEGLALLVEWWKAAGGQWQLTVLQWESGWVQKLFRQTPEWAHLPMVVFRGLTQPFLPAAVIAPGAPVWRAIGVWRSAGWFALLPFLVYAPFAALRREGVRKLETYLAFLVWVVLLLSSYRGAGDQWDNPRYRSVFLVAQVSLAAWAWVHAHKQRSPWLARVAILEVVSTLLFVHWYAGRYLHTPRLSLPQTLALLAIVTVLYLGGAVLWDRRRLRSA